MTFGELKIGDKFIAKPCDGDNDGHGGYDGPHYIFEKSTPLAFRPVPTKTGRENARRMFDDMWSTMPDCMEVIQVR
jgi:hypothetical protein